VRSNEEAEEDLT